MEIIFTKHAREMMEKRKISEDEVIQTIKQKNSRKLKASTMLKRILYEQISRSFTKKLNI